VISALRLYLEPLKSSNVNVVLHVLTWNVPLQAVSKFSRRKAPLHLLAMPDPTGYSHHPGHPMVMMVAAVRQGLIDFRSVPSSIERCGRSRDSLFPSLHLSRFHSHFSVLPFQYLFSRNRLSRRAAGVIRPRIRCKNEVWPLGVIILLQQDGIRK
jgi:hypothetical protein